MLADKHDTDSGFFLAFLRWLAGWWTQAQLSRKTGIHRTRLNKYESGKKEPRPATVKTIAAAAGVPERLVGFLRWCLALIRKALITGRVPPADASLDEETRAAALDILERALALARAECALLDSASRPRSTCRTKS
jgi:transcriptional regulator with XRE-family HTH domain